MATDSFLKKMSGFIVLLLSLLLFPSSATTESVRSLSSTISHGRNGMHQTNIRPVPGTITTVAGINTKSTSVLTGEGTLATKSKLISPKGLVFDKESNFFLSDNHKIRKVTASTGIITTVAGLGYRGFSGDEGQATLAQLDNPGGLGVDTAGNVFIADTLNHRIRKLTVSSGVITTVAGNSNVGYLGDNVAATSTSLKLPNDIAIDAAGNIFIADTGNFRIRKVTSSTGIITTIAGAGSSGVGKTFVSYVATKFFLSSPIGVTLDTSGNVFIAGGDLDPCVFMVTASTGNISVVAGTGALTTGGTAGYNGDSILATKAQLNSPDKVEVDAFGNMYISDSSNYRVRKVIAGVGAIVTVAGTGVLSYEPNYLESANSLATAISVPRSVAVAADGSFYFCDYFQGLVRKVSYSESTPSASTTPAPSSTPSSSTAPTPTAPLSSVPVQTPSAIIPTAPTPSASSPSSTSSAPTRTPSTSTSKAPTTSTSSPSSPSSSVPAQTPSTSTSKAPSSNASPSMAPVLLTSTGTQRSATSHVAEALRLTMILLSSCLILHLYRDA